MMSILGAHLFNLRRFVLLEYMDAIVFRFYNGFISQKLWDQVLNCYDLGFCKRVGGRQLSTGTVTFYFFPKLCPTTVLNADSSALRTFLQQLRGEYTLQRTSNHCFTFTPHISCTTLVDLAASLLCTTICCLMLCSDKEWQYNLRSCFSCVHWHFLPPSNHTASYSLCVWVCFTLTFKKRCEVLVLKLVPHRRFLSVTESSSSSCLILK